MLFIKMLVKAYWKSFNQQLKLLCAGLIVWLATLTSAYAQNTSFELWPGTDVWYKITPDFRLSSFATITRCMESNTRDFNLAFKADIPSDIRNAFSLPKWQTKTAHRH